MKIQAVSIVLLMIMMPLTGCVSDGTDQLQKTEETSEAEGSSETNGVGEQESIDETVLTSSEEEIVAVKQ